jgi:hypothetical protein
LLLTPDEANLCEANTSPRGINSNIAASLGTVCTAAIALSALLLLPLPPSDSFCGCSSPPPATGFSPGDAFGDERFDIDVIQPRALVRRFGLSQQQHAEKPTQIDRQRATEAVSGSDRGSS